MEETENGHSSHTVTEVRDTATHLYKGVLLVEHVVEAIGEGEVSYIRVRL